MVLCVVLLFNSRRLFSLVFVNKSLPKENTEPRIYTTKFAGVEYEGTLKDGMFEGEGTLTYPRGQKIDGIWSEGRLISYKFRFADGLEYEEEDWKYCKMPDRRFAISLQEGLNPAGREMLTNVQPTRQIPKDCYDTGDGFFNPKTKCIYSAIHPKKVLRIPLPAEEEWILKQCRRSQMGNVGHRPDLYETWMAGRESEVQEVKEAYEAGKDGDGFDATYGRVRRQLQEIQYD